MIGKAAFSIQCQCSEPMQEVVVGCSEIENNGVKVLVVDQLTSHYQTVIYYNFNQNQVFLLPNLNHTLLAITTIFSLTLTTNSCHAQILQKVRILINTGKTSRLVMEELHTHSPPWPPHPYSLPYSTLALNANLAQSQTLLTKANSAFSVVVVENYWNVYVKCLITVKPSIRKL